MTAGSHAAPRRLYARHAEAADRGRWSVERDVRWDAIDVALARSQPAILDALRDAALIEAYHPVNLAALLAEITAHCRKYDLPSNMQLKGEARAVASSHETPTMQQSLTLFRQGLRHVQEGGRHGAR